MKITTLSAVLCLAAAAVATDIHNPSIVKPDSLVKRGPRAVSRLEDEVKSSHNEHGVEAHNDGGQRSRDKKHQDEEEDEENEENDDDKKKKGDDDDKKKSDEAKKKSDEAKKKSDEAKKKAGDDKKDGGDDNKKGEGDKKTGGESKDVSKNGPGGKPALGKDGKPLAGGNKGAVPNPITNPNIPKDFASPLWLVQPYGASVWEQGRAYVISWGPNPDPVYAKNLKAKSPVDIRLMRGPPEKLTEVQVLKTALDSSLYQFQWTVPATVTPAKDYSIRITHVGDLDTYSHYFEIVKAGDPRSSKSNVGEPLEMPKKGDSPNPFSKGPIIKPAAPPNPPPAVKPVTPATPPAAAKPVKASAASDSMSPSMLAVALTLFGAAYFL